MYTPGSTRPTTGVTIAVPGAPRRVSEKRADRRKRVLLPAILTYAKGTYHYDCLIRDLSENGARIAVPKHAQFPGIFYVINVRDGLAYEVRLVRRVGLELGLWLTRTISLAGLRDSNLDFLRHLWTQRVARG